MHPLRGLVGLTLSSLRRLCGVWCGRFYSFEGGNLSCRNAVVDPANNKHYNMAQAFTAIGWAGNCPVIANASGTTAIKEADGL